MEITTWEQLESILSYIGLVALLGGPIYLTVVSAIYYGLDTGKWHSKIKKHVATARAFHRCISSGTNSSVISAPQWMQVMPNRGGDLRVAGLTSPSMGSLPQKGQGFKSRSGISSTFLASVDVKLIFTPAAFWDMDARLILALLPIGELDRRLK